MTDIHFLSSTRLPRLAIAALLIVGSGVAVSCSAGASNSTEDAQAVRNSVDESTETTNTALSSDAFYQSLALLPVDYEPFADLQAMAASSVIIVEGVISEFEEGRTVGGQKGERGTLDSAIARVEVSEVVKGPVAVGETIDVEVYRPELFPLADMQRTMPTYVIMFFLRDTAAGPQPQEVDESGVVRDASKALYGLVSLQGWIVDIGEQLDSPLAGDGTPSFNSSLRAAPDYATLARSFG